LRSLDDSDVELLRRLGKAVFDSPLSDLVDGDQRADDVSSGCGKT